MNKAYNKYVKSYLYLLSSNIMITYTLNRNTFISSGYKVLKETDLGIVYYIEHGNGELGAVAFSGKSNKPVWHYRFKGMAQLDSKVTEFFGRLESWNAHKLERRAIRKQTKSITRTTIKSFIKKEMKNLYIKRLSNFDGMVDCVTQVREDFSKVQATTDETNRLGILGAWFVGQSRDYFTVYSDDTYSGYEVYNSCGSFILAVKK